MTQNRPKVLVVDDVRDNVRMLGNILKEMCEVVFALSGDEALQKIRVGDVDVVLLDVEMPAMDGYEVLKRIKAVPETAGIPVIFVTARSDASDEEKGLTLGAVDYIAKPFSPAVVKARVKNHLMLRHYAARLESANVALERLAMIDGLTGVLNRRAFYERGEAELARIGRYGGHAAILALDIDHFKRVNDTWGHKAGDIVLNAFANCVRGCLRESDIFGRVGGEEFCILAPNTESAGAAALAERILEVTRNQVLEVEGGSVRITTSIGISDLRKSDGSVADGVARADRALYKAKSSGRDRAITGEH
jgi:two-component system cell cycle response regulator